MDCTDSKSLTTPNKMSQLMFNILNVNGISNLKKVKNHSYHMQSDFYSFIKALHADSHHKPMMYMCGWYNVHNTTYIYKNLYKIKNVFSNI